MRDVVTLFRQYARLDLKRHDRGLSVRELETWSLLKERLDKILGGPSGVHERRRSSIRVPTRLNCSYASRHEFGEAVISNLATGGVFIRTRRPLPVGAPVRLRIRLEDAKQEIDVEGVVVSNNVGPRFENTEGMGIRFARVANDVLEQISALYATELEQETERLARTEGTVASRSEEPLADVSERVA